MTITNGYATLNEYKKNYQRIGVDDTDANDDAFIEMDIEAASRWIDQQSGTRFYTTSADESRKFTAPADGRGQILFDEYCLSITSVTNGDGSSVSTSSLLYYPTNSTPYYGIALKAGSTLWQPDSNGNFEAAITVTGKFGSASVVPADVKLACLEIARALYGRRFGQNMMTKTVITPAGVVQIPEGVPGWAAQAISNHRRIGFA